MAGKTNYTAEGYHTVTPYLIVGGAAKAIDFYKKIFGAQEIMRMPDGDRIGHAELQIGTSKIMLADEYPEMNIRSAKSVGGTAVYLYIYVSDVDAVVANASSAGAKITKPVKDQFYGDRSGEIEDPFGHRWGIATHTEDVPPEEMQRRMSAQKK
jgi:PhnB protein